MILYCSIPNGLTVMNQKLIAKRMQGFCSPNQTCMFVEERKKKHRAIVASRWLKVKTQIDGENGGIATSSATQTKRDISIRVALVMSKLDHELVRYASCFAWSRWPIPLENLWKLLFSHNRYNLKPRLTLKTTARVKSMIGNITIIIYGRRLRACDLYSPSAFFSLLKRR